MKKIKILVTVIFTATGFIISCSKNPGLGNDPGTPPVINCDMINAKFATDILPIVQTQCAIGGGCHGNGSTNGPGPLTNFNQVKNAAGSIKTAVVSGLMPLNGALSQTQIRQISCWVDNGAVNN